MECRKFEITLISARNLERTRNTKNKRLRKDFNYRQSQHGEKNPSGQEKGGGNPAWDFTTTCLVGKQAVEHDGVMLVIKLYRSWAFGTFGDQHIGEVRVSFKELYNRETALRNRLRTLFSYPKGAGFGKTVKYPVKNGGSDSSGLSYRFGEVVIVNQPSGQGSALASVARWVVLIITVATGVGLPIDIPFSWG